MNQKKGVISKCSTNLGLGGRAKNANLLIFRGYSGGSADGRAQKVRFRDLVFLLRPHYHRFSKNGKSQNFSDFQKAICSYVKKSNLYLPRLFRNVDNLTILKLIGYTNLLAFVLIL